MEFNCGTSIRYNAYVDFDIDLANWMTAMAAQGREDRRTAAIQQARQQEENSKKLNAIGGSVVGLISSIAFLALGVLSLVLVLFVIRYFWRLTAPYIVGDNLVAIDPFPSVPEFNEQLTSAYIRSGPVLKLNLSLRFIKIGLPRSSGPVGMLV